MFDDNILAFRYYYSDLSVVWYCHIHNHYDYVIMGAIASLITSLTIVYSTVYSDADQRKHQRSASLAFVWGIHRGPVNSPHRWPVTRKMFPFDDVIMKCQNVVARLKTIFIRIYPIESCVHNNLHLVINITAWTRFHMQEIYNLLSVRAFCYHSSYM